MFTHLLGPGGCGVEAIVCQANGYLEWVRVLNEAGATHSPEERGRGRALGEQGQQRKAHTNH